MNTRNIGDRYEDVAVLYLRQHGYTILERNFRNKIGEIDIIAKDGEYLVFVEVKYRRLSDSGHPTEAVNFSKQRRITKTALYYCAHNNKGEYTPMRFDVISILGDEIMLYQNAFEAVT